MVREPSVRHLESAVATAQSLGFRGTMYTVGGSSSWSTPPSIWFNPAVHSPFLGTFGWAVRWLVPS